MRAWQSGRKASGAKMANSVAHLATFGMMYAAMRALLGMAKDDEEVERLGRSFDQAGQRLGREFDTSNRINITDVPILGSTVAALAKMHGDTGEDDYWLRVRKFAVCRANARDGEHDGLGDGGKIGGAARAATRRRSDERLARVCRRFLE